MKLSEKKQQLLFTITSNLLLQTVTAICGFILPPLIVLHFGSSMNGMVSSINQFIAYLNLVEAGVGGAAIAALYKPLSNSDSEKRNQILSAARGFYNRSGIFFTILVFALSAVYPFIVASQVSKIEASLLVLILGITGAGEFFLIGKYRVLLTADRKVYVVSTIQIIATIFNTFVAVILIQRGFSILVVKFASSCVFLLRYIPLAIYTKHTYPDVSFIAAPDKTAISQSKNVMVHQIGSLVVRNSPIIVITVLCTLKDASIYSVYAMIFFAVKQIITSFSNGIEAFLGSSLSSGNIKSTQITFAKYETMFFALVFCVYSLTASLCIPFMKIYTRNMTDADYIQPILSVLFVVIGVFDHLRTPGDKLISAAGHFRQTQWRSLLEAAINLIASITFTLIFGFKGVLFGSICSYAYRTFDIIFYASKYIIHIPAVKSLLKIASFIPLTAVLLFITEKFRIEIASFMQWILYAIILGFFYGIVFLSVLLVQIKFFRHQDNCYGKK